MLTIVLMCAGALIGRFLLPPWWVRGNSRVQAALTVLLIFTMGVSIGLDSALFCLIPMAASVALVHLLARRALGVGKGR